MVKARIDTNILIDYLTGVPQARAALAHYPRAAISIINWMQVLAGASATQQAGTATFLNNFDLIDLDAAIAAQAVIERRARWMKLPGAIIWATAQTAALLLVTRDT